jgi:glycosyltransferase involved in cell wall biosynthesis
MRALEPKTTRLLVYVDVPYLRDAAGFSTDRAFLKFLIELASRYDRTILVGRVRPGRSDYSIPDRIKVVPLPDYPTLRDVTSVLAATPRALRVLWREVARADAVLSVGPHPLSLPTALFALVRRRPLTVMVRQNYPQYIRHRLPSPRWRPFVVLAYAFDKIFRIIGRWSGAVVVGDELAARYQVSRRLLNLPISLMPETEHATHPGPGTDDELRLLSVTRLDPEKSPHLLIEAVSILSKRRPDRRILMTVAGTGPLREELERVADERVPGKIRFAGYVPHGERLFELYRSHDVLVHTAKTEGIPQVVLEAQFIGLPVVATEVGGVGGAVGGGESALLVAPGDAPAIVRAVERICEDDDLRTSLVAAGLRATRPLTLQTQVDKMAAFMQSA